jgi:biotin carboxyl carrier protein
VELIVRAGEREERVTVERTPAGYRVSVAGADYDVDTVAVGNGVQSLRSDGNHYDLAIAGDGDGRYRIASRRAAAEIEVMSPLAHLARQAMTASGRRGPERVTAYMPGRVVAVLVEEGAEVEAGQGVVVLEAMKMENEIQAERAGVVRRVLVEAGQSVEGGEGLFELE